MKHEQVPACHLQVVDPELDLELWKVEDGQVVVAVEADKVVFHVVLVCG